MIDRSDAPAMAALVACPAHSECPAYFAESSPARCASFFTTRATSMPDNQPGCTDGLPFRSGFGCRPFAPSS
jgi:hypothetical protein